jgi:hypothetical protein
MQSDERETLQGLAKGLFSQIVTFGRIGIPNKKIPYLPQLIAVCRHLLLSLERQGPLHAPNPNLPFIANRTVWSAGTPVAGYFNEAVVPSLSDVVRSYDLLWSIEMERGHAQGPSLRAALFICADRGFEAAIRYVIDLQLYGFLSGVKSCERVIRTLVWARQSAADECDIPSLFFNAVPTTHLQWNTTEFSGDLLCKIRAPDDDPSTADLILKYCRRHIEQIRSAANFTEWTVSQLNLARVLFICLNHCKWLLPNPSIVTRTYWNELTEIMGDAFSYIAPAPAPLLRASFTLARDLSIKLAAIDCDTWKRRVLKDRLVLPVALKSLVDEPNWLDLEASEQLSDLWKHVSPEFGFPVNLAVRQSKPSPFLSVSKFDASKDELDRAAITASAYQKLGRHSEAATVLTAALKDYPYCHYLRFALAESLFKLDRPPDALK